MKISVIIPAYKCQNYLKDCLDSIHNQTFFKAGFVDYEILLCIDNCPETLNVALNNKHEKLRIFANKKDNAYPYVLRNTMLKKSTGTYILFFDADDIAMPFMISEIMQMIQDDRPIRFKFVNFIDGDDYKTKNKPYHTFAHGVFFAHKDIINKIGGFQSWNCGADSEFMSRCLNNGIKDINIDKPLFYRRKHESSLTQNKLTKPGSIVRKKAIEFLNTNNNWNIPIKAKTIKLKELK